MKSFSLPVTASWTMMKMKNLLIVLLKQSKCMTRPSRCPLANWQLVWLFRNGQPCWCFPTCRVRLFICRPLSVRRILASSMTCKAIPIERRMRMCLILIRRGRWLFLKNSPMTLFRRLQVIKEILISIEIMFASFWISSLFMAKMIMDRWSNLMQNPFWRFRVIYMQRKS